MIATQVMKKRYFLFFGKAMRYLKQARAYTKDIFKPYHTQTSPHSN